ncbi:MAG TPA: 16S rRNA (guanine(527)-N(7))-methyltransferase RsmG [Actinomycetes bacterium]|nr:16S rRNA (guanine(527)-N(7))-methyltransferase RsmG [Actinomycetes bacterium]
MKPLEAPSEVCSLLPSSSRVDLLERYAGWLAGPGIERGLLGPRERDRIWSRHLGNCALVEPLVAPTGSICDLGSGAGLPGVVLAIARPDQAVVLLEPLLRRSQFLAEVVDDLQLSNAEVVRARAEDYASTRPSHRTVVARAVAPLDRLVGWALPLLRPGGELLALKGTNAPSELADAGPALDRAGVLDREVIPLGRGGNVTHAVRVVSPGLDHAGPEPAAEDR